MGLLGWIEVKAVVKQPAWILLAAFSAWVFWERLIPAIRLESPLVGPMLPLSSLGEWSRAMLLALETWGGVMFAPVIVLLATGSFSSELGHQEVLLSTQRGSSLQLAGAKLMAITSIATFLIVIGAGVAVLNFSIRGTMVPAGWQYIPLYLAFTWIRITVWVALTMFFFSLIRSRWGATAIVVALQLAAYMIATQGRMSSFRELLHINLLSWNFVSPFAPLGIIPTAFFLQGLLMAGLVIVLLGASLWVRWRLLGWQVSTSTKGAFVLGVLLAAGTGGAIIWELQNQIAPFTVTELWAERATLDRPYIWSKDFRHLVFPGEYIAVRLPVGAPLPAWVEKWTATKDLHRYDNVGAMILEKDAMEPLAPQSLILIHSLEHPYPPELEGMVRRFRHEIQTLLERAQIWREEVKIIFAWPGEAFFFRDIFSTTEGLLVPVSLLSEPDLWPWPFVWALTATSGLDELAKCYLSMYLMAGRYIEEVTGVLAWLHEEAEGQPLRKLEQARQALERIDERETIRITMGCSGPAVLCRYVHMKPEAARRILDHWKQGEAMGHENYIRSLLEGRRG